MASWPTPHSIVNSLHYVSTTTTTLRTRKLLLQLCTAFGTSEWADSALYRGLVALAYALHGGQRKQSGHWREAQALLQKGIDLDPLSENFYRRLMLCYHKLGQSAEALSIYRRCQRTLSVSLGISPSPETIAAANQLRSGS